MNSLKKLLIVSHDGSDEMYNAVTLIEYGLKIPSICTLEEKRRCST